MPFEHSQHRHPDEPGHPPGDGRVSRDGSPRKQRLRLVGLAGLLLLSVLAVAAVIAPRSPRAPSTPLVGSDARSDAHSTGTPALPTRFDPTPARSVATPAASASTEPPGTDVSAAADIPFSLLQAAGRSQTPALAPHVLPVPDVVPVWMACSPDMGSSAHQKAPLMATTCPATVVPVMLTTVGSSRADTGIASAAASPSATVPATNGQIVAAAVSVRALQAATAPAIQTAHPRMLLDSTTLSNLRAAASANTSAWTALKTICDSYIGGTVGYPTDNAYPNLPNLGQGYQGSDYVRALLSEAMCYQVLKSSNPSAAAPYGAKGVDILLKMSTPYTTSGGNQGQNPCTDSGYGIRYYGVGFGLGYDWLYELLTPTQLTQVYTAGNAWVTSFENPTGCSYWLYAKPLSNYYAGYFHAKAVIAIATYGDNPSAPTEWNDWYTNQYGQRVQPYFALHMAGGGWPEGYGNYGPPAILNMSLPMREVKTATGVDLVHATTPFRFPLDSADYVMHFTWPSRAYFDDRDTNHANGTPTPPVGTPWLGMFQQMLGALVYWGSPEVGVFNQYLSEVNAATSGYSPADTWLLFLDTNPSLPTTPVNTLPLSYLATGMGAVAARSDWTTSASWMSFRAGPYIDNNGEEGFDQGSLALARGNVPLLVNAFGWMVHEPNGSSDENLLYSDLFADFNGTQYMGNREFYNIFYVRRMNGSSLLERFGQDSNTTEDNHVSTKVAAYEDRDGYVFMQATGLADMYRTFSVGPAVVNWTRQIVYLRPNQFVVYDRTTAGNASYDQYLAWHFPANPVAGSTLSGQNRLDVTYNGTYAGAMTTVLPAGSSLTTVPLYPTSNPTKVWQIQERSPTATASQQWLTVFDLSASASAVAGVAPVTITQGSMVGVQLTTSGGNSVVLQSAAAAGTPVTGTIAYSVPAALAHHVITELQPSTGYNITVSVNGGNLAISVSQGGTYMSSSAGVLDFSVNAGGTISLSPQVPLTAPISDLPVPGYPKPYKP